MKPTHSALRHRNDGSVLSLRRSGNRDFLEIRVSKTNEFNAITIPTMKREVESLKSGLRALRTGHLPTSKVRLPWTPEEKHRHDVNGHAEYDNRCEICVKSSGISRHLRVYSESCAFDYANVTFKDANDFVSVLTGRGPRCECFCRVVPQRGESHNEEFLKHVLTAACEQVHFGVQQHSFRDACVELARREPCSNYERNGPTSERVSQCD